MSWLVWSHSNGLLRPHLDTVTFYVLRLNSDKLKSSPGIIRNSEILYRTVGVDLCQYTVTATTDSGELPETNKQTKKNKIEKNCELY